MVDYIEKRDRFREFYADHIQAINSAERSFRNLLNLLLSSSQEFITPKIQGRVKDRNGCIEKFNLKYRKEVEKSKKDYEIKDFITDLIGVRVVCHYESDIDKVVSILRSNFETVDFSDKTSELLAKRDSFGYKGIHLDLRLNEQRLHLPEYSRIAHFQFEVQVRSIVQDAWSEVDHKLKYKNSLSDRLQRRVTNLAALFELADREFDAIRAETIDEIEAKIKQDVREIKERINVFNVLSFLSPKFPEHHFEDYKIEGFIYEILAMKELSIGDFKVAFDEHYTCVMKYRSYLEDYGERMNPFTIIRHILYLNNSRTFKSILFDLQRDNFDMWLTTYEAP